MITNIQKAVKKKTHDYKKAYNLLVGNLNATNKLISKQDFVTSPNMSRLFKIAVNI